MPTDTQLTGASVTMMISGQKYSARTLTDKDFAELDEYIQFCIIETARKASQFLSPQERKESLAAAILAATGVRWSGEEGSKVFNTVAGASYLTWAMIKHNHKVTSETFEEIFSQEKYLVDNITEMDRVFIKLNTETESSDDEKDEGKN